jgi:uncharacterized protein
MANWQKITSRGKVDDRRGVSGGGIGIIGVIAVLGLTYLTGGDVLSTLLQLGTQELARPQLTDEQLAEFAGLDAYEEFSATVLGSIDDYWQTQLPAYVEPQLVLFRGRTSSACGGASSLSGPHYCPVDNTIYLDETFFEELTNRFGARGGDVAQAYVIAHEVGHHVQNISGGLSANRSNTESIETELTADCYAGAWAGSIADDGVFAEGEIIEALDAASAVGDDNIQSRTSGTVRPESWTHGSSEQRKTAFTLGYQNPDNPNICR